MTTKSNILLVGAGAIGGLYAFILTQSQKAKLTVVCRSNYDVVVKNGFNIQSSKFGNHPAFRPHEVVRHVPKASETEPFEFIVVTTKCLPNLSRTSDVIRDAVTPGKTTIVLIQNGIGIEKDVQNAFPHNTIISCVAYITASQISPGHIRHKAMEILHVGGYWNSSIPRKIEQDRINQFADILIAGDSQVIISSEIQQVRWQKLMWNATWSSLCTLTRSGTWALLSNEISPISIPLLERALHELLSVIRIEYPEFPESAIHDTIIITEQILPDEEDIEQLKNDGLLPADASPDDSTIMTLLKSPTTPWYKPSMLVDFENNRPMELQVILGEPVRRAKEACVQVPILESWYHQLSILDLKARPNPRSNM